MPTQICRRQVEASSPYVGRYSSFQELEGEKAGAKGPLQQAFAFILGSWMREYPEDFLEAPDSSCLQQLVAYLHLNMPGSIEEHQACLLLTHLELRNPKQPELEAGIEDIKPCAGALAAISEPGGPNPLEPSTLEPGNDEEVPVSTPETQLPQGKAEANPPSAPTPVAGADQAEAPMSTVAETCVLEVAAA
ncbi:ral guanine nucleotide dissociation stimulator-like 1 [Thomomys bottae]